MENGAVLAELWAALRFTTTLGPVFGVLGLFVLASLLTMAAGLPAGAAGLCAGHAVAAKPPWRQHWHVRAVERGDANFVDSSHCGRRRVSGCQRAAYHNASGHGGAPRSDDGHGWFLPAVLHPVRCVFRCDALAADKTAEPGISLPRKRRERMERTQKTNFACLIAASLCFAAALGSGNGALFGLGCACLALGLQALAGKEGGRPC